jgi:hypothetical protein
VENQARERRDSSDFGPDSEIEELIMDSFGSSICEQCNEEYVFRNASKCARCLGVNPEAIDDEDEEEESSSISLDRSTAA